MGTQWKTVRVKGKTLENIYKKVARSNGEYESIGQYVDEKMQLALAQDK